MEGAIPQRIRPGGAPQVIPGSILRGTAEETRRLIHNFF